MWLRAIALITSLLLTAQGVTDEPFVAVGLWYAGPGVQPPRTATTDVESLRRDLTAIRKAGFNSITTWIDWREAEAERGEFALAGVERLLAAAAEADLRAGVVVFVEPAPGWAAGATDAPVRFVAYVRKRLSLQRGLLDVARHTQAADEPPARIPVTDATAPGARLAMWSAVARGARRIAFWEGSNPLGTGILSLGETAGVITRNQALFAPLRPRSEGVASISAGDGPPIEVRMMESADALMIIGLNYSPTLRKAIITFAPEIPEAIWQNLETGTSVNFVMGSNGPVLEHTFGPRDALVLVIRKTLR